MRIGQNGVWRPPIVLILTVFVDVPGASPHFVPPPFFFFLEFARFDRIDETPIIMYTLV